MKYLLIILTTLIFGTSPTDLKKIKKEKREFDVEAQTNETEIKKLKKTTKYSATGQIISEIDACNDSICCEFNKSFRLHKNKNEYWYEDKRLTLRVFSMCDTLPVYKDFYEYRFNDKKKLVEKRKVTYNFQTRDKKYEKGQWVSAKVGDSTLTETNIHIYTYTEFDSIKEEKIIIRSIYSDKEEKSWTNQFKYDKKNRLVKEEQPPHGQLKLEAQWFYDEKSRVIRLESNLTGDDLNIEWSYDEQDRVSSQKAGNMITNYQYDSNGNLVLVSTIGNKYKDTQTRYYYNEFGDIVRKEVSYDNEKPYVTVYEYSYY